MLAASSGKRNVTVRPSVRPVGEILNATHQGAARDATSVHFHYKDGHTCCLGFKHCSIIYQSINHQSKNVNLNSSSTALLSGAATSIHAHKAISQG